jgi:hypothetical protein
MTRTGPVRTNALSASAKILFLAEEVAERLNAEEHRREEDRWA